jgi:hypothetical protein
MYRVLHDSELGSGKRFEPGPGAFTLVQKYFAASPVQKYLTALLVQKYSEC